MSAEVEQDKKRKRHMDGSSKPSKRVAIEEEDKQIQVSVSEVGKWAPVIGLYPHLNSSLLRFFSAYYRL